MTKISVRLGSVEIEKSAADASCMLVTVNSLDGSKGVCAVNVQDVKGLAKQLQTESEQAVWEDYTVEKIKWLCTRDKKGGRAIVELRVKPCDFDPRRKPFEWTYLVLEGSSKGEKLMWWALEDSEHQAKEKTRSEIVWSLNLDKINYNKDFSDADIEKDLDAVKVIKL